MCKICRFPWILVIYILYTGRWQTFFVDTATKITNIYCTSLDKNYSDFQRCRLLVPRRNEISMDIHVRAYQLPVNNISINLSLWHKTNSFQPFLYNQTYDYCKFMRKPTRMPFLKIFFDAIKKTSNINHTCPYNHDLIVKGFVMNDGMFRLLPLPGGTYMFKLRVATLNAWRAEVGVQFLLDLKSK